MFVNFITIHLRNFYQQPKFITYPYPIMINTLQQWWKNFRWHYKERHFRRFRSMNTGEIFSTIYKENIWGGKQGQFYSGEGTYDPDAEVYIEKLVNFVRQHNIKSIAEVGCGDFTIMKKVLAQLPDVKFTGMDVVPALIAYHKENHQTDRINFQVTDAIEERLAPADLLIIRQVLQHLKNDAILKILSKIGAYRYALISEHIPITKDAEPNLEKSTGPHIRMRINSGVFIDQPPFSIKNTSTFFEYRADDKVKKKMVPAVLRTYLVLNQ